MEKISQTKSEFEKLSDSNKSALIFQANNMIEDALLLRFGDTEWYLPAFDLNFTEKEAADFSDENIVVVVGRHDTFLDPNASFYQIRYL